METLLAPARLIFSSRNLWLWIATSLLLSALANGLAWRFCRPAGEREHRWLRWPVALLRETGRFFYFVGLPYVALLGGLIPATQAGLINEDWLHDLTLALPLGVGAFLVLLSLRALVLWRERTAPGGGNPGEPPLPFGVALRESVYQEIHWAFYRVAPLLALDDFAQGIALGLGIVALEAWLDPSWRRRWQDPALALVALRTAGLAVTMAIVFGFTANLWLTLGVHVAVDRACGWAWGRMGGAPDQAE